MQYFVDGPEAIMIGIPQLDRLTSEQMQKILDREFRIAVRDPRKIQLTVEDVPIEEMTEPPDPWDIMMDQNTVDILIKMELESRAGLVYLAKKIKELKHD